MLLWFQYGKRQQAMPMNSIESRILNTKIRNTFWQAKVGSLNETYEEIETMISIDTTSIHERK